MNKIALMTGACLYFLLSNGIFSKLTGQTPTGLMCELLAHPEKSVITDSQPEFSWIVRASGPDEVQTAYQILVASDAPTIGQNRGDLWDSEKVVSSQSVQVSYAGAPLAARATCYWKVRTWNKRGEVGPYSAAQLFHMAGQIGVYATARYPLETQVIAPVKVVEKGPGHYFVDFGRDAFGTIELTFSEVREQHQVQVHLGEKLKDENSIDENPGGTIRFRLMTLDLREGQSTYRVAITPDERNTRERAIKMPSYSGEVMPFRYCEIVNSPCDLDASNIRQLVVHYPFDDQAARFSSSSQILNDIWELCKYSIKATSFCGVYVDGDRERIPYEADAYINQLCHYHVDREYTLARYSHEYLIVHPTWPTEWILQSVLMAWADYLYTGDQESMQHFYQDLKEKTLYRLQREDGLISTRTGLVSDEVLKAIHFSGELRDIVDWPPGSFTKGGKGEQDDHVFMDINTVVNAFHYRALVLMARMAGTLRIEQDAQFFAQRADLVLRSFNEKLFDHGRGIYIDGIGTDHASLHSNMFALAFGLVPENHRNTVVAFLKSRGMACSVYGAQYLLDALYLADEGEYALQLMTATDTDRSWPHMTNQVGTTITLEAWDKRYKENLDWNHAWGAAPANIIARGLMGVEPLQPGFAHFQIKPQPGPLAHASLDLPTIRGTIHVDFQQEEGAEFVLTLAIPANSTARVYLPKLGSDNAKLQVNGVKTKGRLEGEWVVLACVGSGTHRIIRSAR